MDKDDGDDIKTMFEESCSEWDRALRDLDVQIAFWNICIILCIVLVCVLATKEVFF